MQEEIKVCALHSGIQARLERNEKDICAMRDELKRFNKKIDRLFYTVLAALLTFGCTMVVLYIK